METQFFPPKLTHGMSVLAEVQQVSTNKSQKFGLKSLKLWLIH